MATANSNKARSSFSKRGGYSGSKLKTLPKVTSPAATAKGSSNGKGPAKAKS